MNINGRRHSTPLSSMAVSTMWGSNEDDSILDLHDQQSFHSNKPVRLRLSHREITPPASPTPSPMSFINLSDDDSAAETRRNTSSHRRQVSTSGESMVDGTASLLTLTSTKVHEEDQFPLYVIPPTTSPQTYNRNHSDQLTMLATFQSKSRMSAALDSVQTWQTRFGM